MTTQQAPLPELGWRAWGIGSDDKGPVLIGRQWTVMVFGEAAHFPTMPARAFCMDNPNDPNHLPPHPDCTCGLYFTWDRFTVESIVFPNPFNRGAKVLGQVLPSHPILTVPHDEEGAPDEQRTGSLTLQGEQLLTPVCADLAPALSDRYGIEFTPDESLLSPPPEPWEEAAYDMLDRAREFAKQAGLPPPLPFLQRPTKPKRFRGTPAWSPPSKAEQRARRSPNPSPLIPGGGDE